MLNKGNSYQQVDSLQQEGDTVCVQMLSQVSTDDVAQPALAADVAYGKRWAGLGGKRLTRTC